MAPFGEGGSPSEIGHNRFEASHYANSISHESILALHGAETVVAATAAFELGRNIMKRLLNKTNKE